MFSIGEHIIHPGQGVCTVMGYEDAPSPMIILEAKRGHAKTRMMYPVAQQDRLHTCISREVAERLLDDYDEIEVDPFTERNSSLEETYFKKQLKYGAPQTIRVAKPDRGPKGRPYPASACACSQPTQARIQGKEANEA